MNTSNNKTYNKLQFISISRMNSYLPSVIMIEKSSFEDVSRYRNPQFEMGAKA